MKEETKQKISQAKKLGLPEDIVTEIYLMGFSIKKVSDMFHCSFEAIRRIITERGITRTNNEVNSGENNPMYDTHRAGKDNPNWRGGKPHCIECGRELVSRSAIRCKECSHNFQKGENHPLYGIKGEDNPSWTGGRLITWIRHSAKRKEMEFIPLNKSFVNSEGHHIDDKHVIFIPKKLHRLIPHNLNTGKGMYEINLNAFEFLRNPELQLGDF